jgi:hypothetical protein
MEIGLERTFWSRASFIPPPLLCCAAANRASKQNNLALSSERMMRPVRLDGTGQFARRPT